MYAVAVQQSGSAVARHTVVRATCKVNGKGQTFIPDDIKISEFFKFELDVHDYVPEIDSNANFHFNPFSGASLQTGEM